MGICSCSCSSVVGGGGGKGEGKFWSSPVFLFFSVYLSVVYLGCDYEIDARFFYLPFCCAASSCGLEGEWSPKSDVSTQKTDTKMDIHCSSWGWRGGGKRVDLV